MRVSVCVCVVCVSTIGCLGNFRKSTSFRSINNSCRPNRIYHSLVIPNNAKTRRPAHNIRRMNLFSFHFFPFQLVFYVT